MKTRGKILSISLLISASCTYHDIVTPGNGPNLTPLSATDQAVAAANNAFAFDLFHKVQSESTTNNIFISPLSVTLALGMTMNGACDSTQQSILRLLKFGSYTPLEVDQSCKNLTNMLLSMDRTVQLGLANSVWNNVHYAVRDSFTTTINNYFDGNVQALNFSDPNSVSVINNWVASKTNQRIKNVIDQTSENDAMFLINAIYFKGDWTYPFDPANTYSAPFYQPGGSSQNVPTMVTSHSSIKSFINKNLTMIDIPYGNQQFSMTVLMPSENHSLNSLVETLTMDSLNVWLSMAGSTRPVLELPKFEMTWKKDLLNDLKGMGMYTVGFPHLFEENLALEISNVYHQSYVNVDETGTEATAATTVAVTTSAAGPPFTIKINRPFVYLIREKHTNAILFIGQMILPSSQ